MVHKNSPPSPRRSDGEYHDEYYASREIPDQELIVQVRGFRESLDNNLIGDLYRCLLDRIGDVQGKYILDYGCGAGQVGVFFALSGANVRGFDASEQGVEIANRRARLNRVSERAMFQSMEAGSLKYEDGVFDFIVGRWILHHLNKEDLDAVGGEMKRVLKKGGKALFIEPLGHNLLIEFLRKRPFYSRGDYESEHESTMRTEDLLALGKGFQEVLIHKFHLLYMLKRVIRNKKILAILKGTDDSILRVFPFLKRYCGECVVECIK